MPDDLRARDLRRRLRADRVEGCDDGNLEHNDGCANTCRQGATAIAAGYAHTCALRAGKLRCWGWNGFGQLGDGTTANIGDELADLPPDDVRDDVLAVTAGHRSTCALLVDNSVRCRFSPDEWSPPVMLGGAAERIDAGTEHTCAVLVDGTVRCWGINENGECGYPGQVVIPSQKPIASVTVGAPVKQVAAGGGFTCALLADPVDGKVRCWGRNDWGQLGLGNTEPIGFNEHPSEAPFVEIGESVLQIDAGTAHACALAESGAVYCWGFAWYGQLGYMNQESIGDDEDPVDAGPVKMLAATDEVAEVKLGGERTCARLVTGDIRCWGWGAYGQLGHENTASLGHEPSGIAPPVAVGAEVRALALGDEHTCAIIDGGAIRCWGHGADGRLARGDTQSIGDEPGEMPPKDSRIHDNP